MTDKPEPNIDQEVLQPRPDPIFKLVTQLEAHELGLQTTETELQYSARADLVLTVPTGIKLEGTMFDFFRTINVLEFKSQNDKFNLQEFVRNELRTALIFLQGQHKDFANILNIIVSSREPTRFFQESRKHGLIFKPEETRPWLWRCQVGFQDIAIVVCRDLPIEKPYYQWLAFAPTNSAKWNDFAAEIVRQNNQTMVDLLKRLKPKEFAMVEEKLKAALDEAFKKPEFNESVEETPELRAELLLEAIAHDHPERLSSVLSVLQPEERLADLQPEERVAGLSEEDLLASLTPEQRKKLLKLLQEQTKEE